MMKHVIVVALSLFALLVLVNGEKTKEKTDEIVTEDYSWDYDEDSEVKPRLSDKQLISLTRDWLGREDPDASPTYGWFPVWAVFLGLLSGFFFVLALCTGLLHVLGCKGRRPQYDTYAVERRTSLTTDKKKDFKRLNKQMSTVNTNGADR